jgi:hypothetical protein
MINPRQKDTADPVVKAYKSGVDVTLIRENLRRTIDERFLQLMEMQRFAKELQEARKRAESKTK